MYIIIGLYLVGLSLLATMVYGVFAPFFSFVVSYKAKFRSLYSCPEVLEFIAGEPELISFLNGPNRWRISDKEKEYIEECYRVCCRIIAQLE